MTAATTNVAHAAPVLDALRGRLRGALLAPGDAEFDAARRVWNGMIDRSPAAIVRCAGPADAIAAVNAARTHGLPVSVRGGGHNVTGAAVCDGGLVVDLSAMRGVRVDPERRRVRAEGGARLGDLDHETIVHGLAVPVGVVSRTGVAGLSLHGGMGFLSRRYGLTCDHLVAADVVTADGVLRVADDTQNADLLWALRGGGGGFGVVTSFEFQAHPVSPQVWIAMTLYPARESATCLRGFQAFMAQAPDALTALGIFWSAPHEDPIPEPHRGAEVFVVVACWSGDPGAGEQAIAPLRRLATPLVDLSGPMPYAEAQRLFDPEYPDGRRYYWKSVYLNGLDDPTIAFLADHAAKRPSKISSVDVWALGGALSRGRAEAGAFGRPKTNWLLGIEANWEDPAADAANVAWARAMFDAAAPHSPGGAYLNFPGQFEEGTALLEQTFGAHWAKLRAVKAQYDPRDLFRSALRIPPGA
jgi:FAD/FMN-containing dehydrogenase